MSLTPDCSSALLCRSCSPPALALGLNWSFVLIEDERYPKMSCFLPAGCEGKAQWVLDCQTYVPGQLAGLEEQKQQSCKVLHLCLLFM